LPLRILFGLARAPAAVAHVPPEAAAAASSGAGIGIGIVVVVDGAQDN